MDSPDRTVILRSAQDDKVVWYSLFCLLPSAFWTLDPGPSLPYNPRMSDSDLGLPWPGVGDLFLLRPGVAFLNHGSFGACPQPVFDAYQAWQRQVEDQPVEFLGRRINDLLAEARSRLGSYLGADADDLVFVPNATHGTNIVARSLDLQPGDEVLSTDHEYGAADRTWRFICGLRGAHYL